MCSGHASECLKLISADLYRIHTRFAFLSKQTAVHGQVMHSEGGSAAHALAQLGALGKWPGSSYCYSTWVEGPWRRFYLCCWPPANASVGVAGKTKVANHRHGLAAIASAAIRFIKLQAFKPSGAFTTACNKTVQLPTFLIGTSSADINAFLQVKVAKVSSEMSRVSTVFTFAVVLLLAAASVDAAAANPLAGRQLRQLMQQGSKYDQCNQVSS
jgi:hypothetical protein